MRPYIADMKEVAAAPDSPLPLVAADLIRDEARRAPDKPGVILELDYWALMPRA